MIKFAFIFRQTSTVPENTYCIVIVIVDKKICQNIWDCEKTHVSLVDICLIQISKNMQHRYNRPYQSETPECDALKL